MIKKAEFNPHEKFHAHAPCLHCIIDLRSTPMRSFNDAANATSFEQSILQQLLESFRVPANGWLASDGAVGEELFQFAFEYLTIGVAR